MSQRKLAFAILLFGALGFTSWFNGMRLDFLALLDVEPMAGMYGAVSADLRKESPTERAARFERLRELRAEVKWSVRVSCDRVRPRSGHGTLLLAGGITPRAIRLRDSFFGSCTRVGR
jgi:hypothetical protein